MRLFCLFRRKIVCVCLTITQQKTCVGTGNRGQPSLSWSCGKTPPAACSPRCCCCCSWVNKRTVKCGCLSSWGGELRDHPFISCWPRRRREADETRWNLPGAAAAAYGRECVLLAGTHRQDCPDGRPELRVRYQNQNPDQNCTFCRLAVISHGDGGQRREGGSPPIT